MTALAVLIPGLIVGAIAWGAVGILRQRGREAFTAATAAAFYAQVALIAGVLAVLAGLAVAAKLMLSLIDARWAYFTPNFTGPEGFGPGSVAQQQGQDVILASMLVVVGGAVAAGHWFLARRLAAVPGGSPSWVAGGAEVAISVLTGLAGALSLVIGGYGALSYFLVGVRNGATFADPLGVAIVFVPAWLVAMTFMLRRARRTQAPIGPGMPVQPA